MKHNEMHGSKKMMTISHGTRASFRAGCTCDLCHQASNQYQRQLYDRRKAGIGRPNAIDAVRHEYPSVMMGADEWMDFLRTDRGDDAFTRIVGDLLRLGWGPRRRGPQPLPDHVEAQRRLRLLFWQLHYDTMPSEHPDCPSKPLEISSGVNVAEDDIRAA